MTPRGLARPAATLCQVWVGFYTWRLPAEAAKRRRDEIESDLFEHTREAGSAGATSHRLAAEILGRVLVGVPADLSWRRATRREPRQGLALGGTSMSMSTTAANRLLTFLGALTVIYVWGIIVADAFFLPKADDEIGWGLKALFGAPALAGNISMITGLTIRHHSPRAGFRFIVAGALGPAVWFWMLPIYGPLLIATIAVATIVTPRKNSPKLAPT